ncbi:uncharacterized protein LOC123313971 [Coccinella septempunctata]|uniref:uncharacterized protein LOC123313971 n=1 Tax=Coccinella septempunctata TaxID=41139 RepID=UPI001D05C8E5|nr:uncharacterized protein LOC123313971 [Coccinella septempunctata]
MSSIPKLFESLVYKYIASHIKHSIVEEQHGFIRGRSLETNLLQFTEYLCGSLDDRSQVDVIYTDFEKAFDKVSHLLLSRRLAEVGVTGNLLRWLSSYIRNRSQYVVINGECSDTFYCTSGVPQGSHLGPLLFIIYINGLKGCFRYCEFLLYADDLKFFRRVSSVDDCNMIQDVLLPLEPFNGEGEIGSVGIQWEKWKRALEIYLEAANVHEASRKRATLLHLGGFAIQEIYYNLPGAHVTETGENIDVNKRSVEKLDEYFAPKQSKLFERHIFRLIKQESGEKFERFLVRLRNQAHKCKFVSTEENIIDQIVEKCQSADLRKKVLTMGDAVTLDAIIAEANALEAVTRQMENFEEKKPFLGDVQAVATNGGGSWETL